MSVYYREYLKKNTCPNEICVVYCHMNLLNDSSGLNIYTTFRTDLPPYLKHYDMGSNEGLIWNVWITINRGVYSTDSQYPLIRTRNILFQYLETLEYIFE